jgi:hypothetical protein
MFSWHLSSALAGEPAEQIPLSLASEEASEGLVRFDLCEAELLRATRELQPLTSEQALENPPCDLVAALVTALLLISASFVTREQLHASASMYQ